MKGLRATYPLPLRCGFRATMAEAARTTSVFKSSLRIVTVLLSALVLTGSAVASAGVTAPASARDSSTVHACVAKADRYVTNFYGRQIIVIPHGTARIVRSAKACKQWETSTSWSQDGAGQRGADGATGPVGTVGATGATGAAGAEGHNGPTGAAGRGVTMATLAVGDPLCLTGGVTLTSESQTVAVCDGATGATGLAGLAGLDGLDGAPGSAGSAGSAGSNGSNGSNGIDGANGIDGENGFDGAGVSVAALLVGDAVCPTGGVSVTSASSTSYVCNGLRGSAGQNGVDGARGPAGTDGAAGTAGAAGANGTNGLAGGAGAAGANGTNGLAGSTGAAGANGTNGAAGAAGAKGDTGSAGVKGDTGSPGLNSPALGLLGTSTGTARAGNGAECTLGDISLTAATVGVGTPASGQILPIAQNQALFALLGTNYGGNGNTTFGLPNLQALAPNHMTYLICVQGIFPSSG
jgi:Phage Tail Collar Domain/Collagen triple helix repeat (20 copies)